MLSQLFAEQIAAELNFPLTADQQRAALEIADFLTDPRTEQAFILKGYAGTGKTSLVAAVVRVWQKLGRSVVLLAPTGRAAKVLSQHAGASAYTIHKHIYRQQTFVGEDTSFDKGWNKYKDTLFVVDEASMIANFGGSRCFGSGQLLDDLVEYVYAGVGCRLMLVGDTAQLPPIGESESPALQQRRLAGLGLNVREAVLTQVVRQKEMSLVLYNATCLRTYLLQLQGQQAKVEYLPLHESLREEKSSPHDCKVALSEEGLPLITHHDKRELRLVMGEDLIECLENSYRNWGTDETIIITKSNKRAIRYNNGVRNRIFEYDDLLVRGDRVMVVKNNYFWTAKQAQSLSAGETLPMDFIANGETAEVLALRNVHRMHGFQFADALLRFSAYDYEMECRILLDTLQSEAAALTAEEAQQLFEAVHADYMDIANQRERMKAIRQDAYYNALQIKYAYAITCHKAQGGQWAEVYVDQGYIPEDTDLQAHIRWLYTAFTRSARQLYLVNWPPTQSQRAVDEE